MHKRIHEQYPPILTWPRLDGMEHGALLKQHLYLQMIGERFIVLRNYIADKTLLQLH